jgi:hypothetical protein
MKPRASAGCFSFLIRGCAERRDLDRLEAIYVDSLERGRPLSAQALVAAVRVFAQTNNFRRVNEILDLMQSQGLSIGSRFMATLVTASLEAGDVTRMRQYFEWCNKEKIVDLQLLRVSMQYHREVNRIIGDSVTIRQLQFQSLYLY